ncbi:MAG: hypothetical protein Ct9H300mP8_05060 [Gammaproteobacteria bacterium]|nr:MAG: hypothetical protein Ct9H300mP8_05060 [Gammaproteobacteria bacterium]
MGWARFEHRQWVKTETQRRLRVAPWIPVHFVPALHGSGVGELFVDIQRVNKAGAFDVKTPELTRVLENAVSDHPPHSFPGSYDQITLRAQSWRAPPLQY